MAKKKTSVVKVDGLVSATLNILDDLKVEVKTACDKSIKEVAEKTRDVLEETAPKRTGKYARSWAVRIDNSIYGIGHAIIHAESPHYRLTHLLNNGHTTRNGGWVKGDDHIKHAEEKAVEELTKEVIKRIENE